MTSPTTIILLTAAAETVLRALTSKGQDGYAYNYAGYSQGALLLRMRWRLSRVYTAVTGFAAGVTTDAADQVVNCVIHFCLVAFLASETLSTNSLVGSIGTQALAFIITSIAARQSWMDVPDLERS